MRSKRLVIRIQAALDVGENLEGELFSEHFVMNRLKQSSEYKKLAKKSEKIFEDLKKIYDENKGTVETINEKSLEEDFIKPILVKLGHMYDVETPLLSHKGVEKKPDISLFKEKETKREAQLKKDIDSDEYFQRSIGLLEAKKWDTDLDKGRDGAPSVQLKRYLRMTNVKWGILTNGAKWRLYCNESGFSANIYAEFNLKGILEFNRKKDFETFFALFSHDSFVPVNGKSFLDRIYEENVRFAEEIEDDLESNVYEALRLLSQGFFEYKENGLVDSDIEKIHDNCLILLYRLLFLFYAESKGLIKFEGRAERYSLIKISEKIDNDKTDSVEYAPLEKQFWEKLQTTFKIINEGSKEGLGVDGIPPYNGGLFDTDKHPLLERMTIGDEYLTTAIDKLARRMDNGSEKRVDYQTLNIRHLGSIYEKLLEYKIEKAETDLTVKDGEYVEAKKNDSVAVEEGSLYLVTDKGERKASGSYYTPDYIVRYIVENTIGPLIEERTKKARDKGTSEVKEILDIKVLDPAMGSGHFLVGAIEYMAKELVEAVNEDIKNDLWGDGEKDENWAKREIVSHCIYGVDLNPLAVELAKLSLWLTTFSEGKPLNFLDHRLKCGNSLIGTEIDQLPYFPGEKREGNLYTPYIELLTEQVSKLDDIEDESLEDVKKKEELFQKIKGSKPYKRVKTLADARTSTHFGVDIGGGDPKQRYMDLVNEAYYGDEKKWDQKSDSRWVREGVEIAEEKRFFHWQLEHPEIFFEKGEFKDNPGFDAVIGNPPYINANQLNQITDGEKNFWKHEFKSAKGAIRHRLRILAAYIDDFYLRCYLRV